MSAIPALAAVILLATSPARPENKMDLICTPSNGLPAVRMSFDLDQARYCFTNSCKPQPLASVTADRIDVVQNVDSNSVFRIFRNDGHYVDFAEAMTFGQGSTGNCVKAPFSGFPANKF